MYSGREGATVTGSEPYLRKAQQTSLWQWYWRAFLICGLAALAILLPFYVIDGGFFHYAGDFNGQQITFYRYLNQLVKDGASYAWSADLGSGAVNAFSFYLYGSPFFWLSLLLPTAWLPYCMVPLLVLKFAVAGGGAMLYLHRYVKNPNIALVGASLYALSGFTVYNVFFNHFVDVVALFPYLLWALDEAVYHRRRGLFAFFAALNLINNYFFFAGQIVFLVIYFVWKCATGEYKLNLKLFTVLAVESLLAAAMGCIIAWPAVLSLAQNPRTVDPAWGWRLLAYSNPQQYLAILLSWILPPDCPYETSIWTEGIIKWTSMTAYLPLCSLAGVLAYWRSTKGGSTKGILGTCAIFALIPALNSAFYCMNSSYYARWYYMPLLLMVLATLKALENDTIELKSGIRPVFWIMLACVAFLLVPVENTGDTPGIHFGVANNPAQLIMVMAFGIAGLLLFGWICARWRGKPGFSRRILAGVLAFACVFSITHIATGKFGQWEHDLNIRTEYEDAVKLGQMLPEGGYRVDTYETRDNLGPWMSKSSLLYFGSTVTPSILEMYPQLGVKRDVRSQPEYDLYALRSLMGVEYMVLPPEKKEDFEKGFPHGWTQTDYETPEFIVYENQNNPGLGLTYSYYVTQEQFDEVSTKLRSNLLLRAILLDEEQIKQYGHLLAPLPDGMTSDLNPDTFQTDCADRKATACSSFTMEKDGFTAAITLEKENLVLFQVPWDEGFTATINGTETPILRVNSGMMAVDCPAGENEIVFTYHTAGLSQSSMVCMMGCVLYAAYLVLFFLRRKRQKAAQNANKLKTEGE